MSVPFATFRAHKISLAVTLEGGLELYLSNKPTLSIPVLHYRL